MTPALHVNDLSAGNGTGTLVLLHGLTDSGACWGGAVRRWQPRGWRVVAPDMRGHGESPRWDDDALAERPGAVMTRDVVGLLDTLVAPDEQVALVGHSMGAAVAAAVAAQVPGKVRGVVAEDPPWPLPPIAAPDPVRARGYLSGQREDLALGFTGRIERKKRETPWWPAEELEPLSRAVDQTDLRLLATGDIVPPTPWPDLLATLERNGVPVLVVTGTRDVRVSAESQAEAERRGARVVRVDGAGHCVRRDRQDAYHDVVDRTLEEWLDAPGESG